MKCLIADCTPALRDQIHVALDAFDRFKVDCSDGAEAISMMDKYQYDLVFAGTRSSRIAPGSALERSLEPGRSGKVFVVAPADALQSLKSQRVRARVMAFLSDPLNAVDLYRSLHRFLQRQEVKSAL